MKYTRLYTISVLLVLVSVFKIAAQQDVTSTIQDYLQSNYEAMGLGQSDISEWKVTDNVLSKHNGVRHVHIVQLIDQVPVKNGVANFAISKNDSVLFVGNRLLSNLEVVKNKKPAAKASVSVVMKAAEYTQMDGTAGKQLKHSVESEYLFEKGTLAKKDINMSLAYWGVGEEIKLVWIVSLYQLDGKHWWQVFIDANTGELVHTIDWVVSCDFKGAGHSSENHQHINKTYTSAPMAAAAGQGQYNVFALPVESPAHGSRSVEFSPADTVASPFGWHDTNGVAGADYTYTRGNNVYAYSDAAGTNSPGYSPNGGVSLNFNFPLNLSQAPLGYQDVSITNLFYTCNRIHDIFYHYGFDEANGNFQLNNYGNGGSGNDNVIAEAQDGGGNNNANFATPADGSNGVMQMYLWGGAGGASNLLTINSPSVISGLYLGQEAVFGPGLSSTPITADIVLALDTVGDTTDACETLVNATELSGKIAILRRGNCSFVNKVMSAQSAGAIAVIIVNNTGGLMSPGGSGPLITIPTIMISQQNGNDIIARLLASDTVNGTLQNGSSASFQFDGDLDNGIVIHEYGHGISNRIAGGPLNSGCLNSAEQMGEGWSDFFATILTMDTSVANPVRRPMATYVQGNTPGGTASLRNASYDTSFAINPYTYGDVADVNNVSQPHGIGFIWATMLWDLNWAFINQYGYDSNIDSGSGGNNMLLQLVLDGLALQPCGPGFVDGRDAILQADMINNNGANQCLIWEVFAKRGLGFSASQGSPNSRTDQVEAFDLPLTCQVAVVSPSADFTAEQEVSCNGRIQFRDLSTDVPQSWYWDFGDGNSDTIRHPLHYYANSGTYTVSLKVSNPFGADSISKVNFIQVTIPAAPTASAGGSGCSSDSIQLSATGANTIGWFDLNNRLLATGNTFKSPPSKSNQTYYAKNGVVYPKGFVGPTDTSIGTGGYHGGNFVGAVNFKAEDEVTIHSALVNSGAPGIRIVRLWDGYNGTGNLLETRILNIPFSGSGRVDLDFEVPGKGDYSIALSNANLYRNRTGASYPYVIPGLISLEGSSASPVGGNDIFYYYFYDLEVSKTPCWSDSVAVTTTVTDTADFSWAKNGSKGFTFTDLSPQATSWSWDFGDGNTSTLQNPNHAYAQNGTYKVTLVINGGSCTVTYFISVGNIGLGELSNPSLQVLLYPNPAKDKLFIEFNEALKFETKIQLYNTSGKMVVASEVLPDTEMAEIPVAQLAPGVYIVQITYKGYRMYQKVIVAN